VDTDDGKSHRNTPFPDVAGSNSLMEGLGAWNSNSACSHEEAEGRVQ